MRGRDGDDRLIGGDGRDKLRGGRGDDRLDGGADRDDLDGGDGNDKLKGGRGNDILIGGAGKDDLKGDDGYDILIGGTGKDKLKGGRGDDLLIGGWTLYDDYVESLRLIMAEWSSVRDYDTRVANLRTGSGAVLNGTGVKLSVGGANQSVFNGDNERDKLKGESDLDWYFAELGKDKITGKKSFEELN